MHVFSLKTNKQTKLKSRKLWNRLNPKEIKEISLKSQNQCAEVEIGSLSASFPILVIQFPDSLTLKVPEDITMLFTRQKYSS